MPIRPERKKHYPKHWRAIRATILARARSCCEGSPRFPDCRAANGQHHPETGSLVVLTVAHMDHDPENNNPDNLRALCQRCHLTHDAKIHAKNASRTRRVWEEVNSLTCIGAFARRMKREKQPRSAQDIALKNLVAASEGFLLAVNAMLLEDYRDPEHGKDQPRLDIESKESL